MAAGKSKSGSMFDPEALMEAHKRNFQALADAGNIVAEGMRSYAERQVSMARESMSQLWNELQSVGKRAPVAPSRTFVVREAALTSCQPASCFRRSQRTHTGRESAAHTRHIETHQERQACRDRRRR